MALKMTFSGANIYIPGIYWTTMPRSTAYTTTKNLLDTMLKLRIIKKKTYDDYFFTKGHF